MVLGRLHSIETMGLVDGPGIRTIFFLQGCPLRCLYCHNPDTQKMNSGTEVTPDFILEKAKRYRTYYRNNGGITFSGGEPLLQGEFLSESLKLLKENGYSTCVDTSGYGDEKYFKEILENTDYLLLDIKSFSNEGYLEIVKSKIYGFLIFMKYVDKYFKGKIWFRHVMLPNFTDDYKSMDKMIEIINPYIDKVERVEILPYHLMGIEKYEKINREYELKNIPAMDKRKAKELENYVNEKLGILKK